MIIIVGMKSFKLIGSAEGDSRDVKAGDGTGLNPFKDAFDPSAEAGEIAPVDASPDK